MLNLYIYILMFFQENVSESSHKREKIPKIIKTARYIEEFNRDPKVFGGSIV